MKLVINKEALNFIVFNAQQNFHSGHQATINLSDLFNLKSVRLKAYVYLNGNKNGNFIEIAQSSNNFDYSDEVIEEHKMAFDFIQKLNAFTKENGKHFANHFPTFVENFAKGY